MIKSEIIKIKYTNDNQVIESELRKIGLEPLRWAVVAVDKNHLLISASFEEK